MTALGKTGPAEPCPVFPKQWPSIQPEAKAYLPATLFRSARGIVAQLQGAGDVVVALLNDLAAMTIAELHGFGGIPPSVRLGNAKVIARSELMQLRPV